MIATDNSRGFDLNIEKVLENWEVYHALREIIANALDEQTLTGTKPIEIFCDSKGFWHIRDYGRGLQYIHFTQNENEEKLNAPNLIGKFGVGLKDALATFDRHGVSVTIQSKHGVFTFDKMQKADFDDIITLHAIVHSSIDTQFVGTEFIIQGCTQADINEAKNMFLRFSSLKCLEDTCVGDVFKRSNNGGKIFINGVLVAVEANFMFSYNITSLNAAIKKALNRERTNVGRTAYADRVKAILLQCGSDAVLQTIAEELKKFTSGEQNDELKWLDVQEHATRVLNAKGNVVFVTASEFQNMTADQRDILENSGKQFVTVAENLANKLGSIHDVDGGSIVTSSTIFQEYRDSFKYEFINIADLTLSERKRYIRLTNWAAKFLGIQNRKIEVKISKTLRPTIFGDDTLGEWIGYQNTIVIRRDMLKTDNAFLSTIIHEYTHATSGKSDCTRDFEIALTDVTGSLAAALV